MVLELIAAFLVLALASFVLGARGVAGFSMEVARVLVVLFLLLAIVTWFSGA